MPFLPPTAPARRSSTTALRPPAHAAPQPARRMGHGATLPGATDGRGTQEGRERHERRQRHGTHERLARGRDAAPPYARRPRGPARGCSSLAQLWAWLLPVSAVFATYHPCRPTVRPPPLRRGPLRMPRPSHLRGAWYSPLEASHRPRLMGWGKSGITRRAPANRARHVGVHDKDGRLPGATGRRA